MQFRTTQKERIEATREMFKDLGKDLSTKEAFRHLYHCWRYEVAVIKIKHGQYLLKKHADILNEDIAAFSMRKDLKDL